MKKNGILVISHGHPDFDYGGGEVAAYNLYEALRDHYPGESVTFLARIEDGDVGSIRPRRVGEYLWSHRMRDFFLFTSREKNSLQRFVEFIKFASPRVIFMHHYVHIGLEIIPLIKANLPDCRIVLTLHEMLAICNNNGQMVKTGSSALCYESSLDDCARCFPGKSREDFWLRKHFISRHFEAVDHFVSPSHFLKDRYVTWGLPADRIRVIENIHPKRQPLPPRRRDRNQPNRFGYFGQINPYKGIYLLLEALKQMPEDDRATVRLELNGANIKSQTPEFQESFKKLVDPLVEEGVVVMRGPYARRELQHRLQSVDWVVMPSVWWENSPMIIQEALGYGRPVICPAVGGMGEKVVHEKTGLHVPSSNQYYWTEMLRTAAQNMTGWNRLYEQLADYGVVAHDDALAAHIELVG